MIEIKGLKFSVKEKVILNDINLTVNAGEIVALIGRSGSGKSALLNILTGKSKKFTGDASIENNPLRSYSSKNLIKKISHMSEVNRENVMDDTLFNFIIHIRKPGKKFLNPYSELDFQVTEQHIDRLGLNDYAGDRILSLPGGIFKKALLARSFVKDARILLLDNPTSDLDINSILLLQKSLQRYVIDGDRLCIIASNDINFISQTADRMVVLENGGIAAEGKPDIITSEFINKYFNIDALVSKNIYNGKPNIHINMEV